MTIVDLEAFNRFAVHASVYDQTIAHIRAAGSRGVECLVIWAGLPAFDHFVVDMLICPRQFATEIGSRVSSEDVDAMYEQLYRNGRVAAAQAHSHPGEAFHSDTDDDFSIVTRRGALSLVIPNFGFGDAADIKYWAGFRFRNTGWKEITPHHLITLERR